MRMEEEVVDQESSVIFSKDGGPDYGYAKWDISTTRSKVRLELDQAVATEYASRLNEEISHLMWLKERYERESRYSRASDVEQEAQALVRVLKELQK